MKKLGILALLVAIALAIVPYFIAQSIDKEIDQNIKSLRTQGVELNITKKSGYFTTKREFSFTVTNGEKFIDYLLKHKILASIFAVNSQNEYVSLFGILAEKTVVTGYIQNSNILPNSDINADFSVSEFANQPIDKVLNFRMTLDSNGGFKNLALKDINTTLEQTQFQTKNFFIDYQADKRQNVHAVLDNINIVDNRVDEMGMDGLDFTYNFKDHYNYAEKTTIDAIHANITQALPFDINAKILHINESQNLTIDANSSFNTNISIDKITSKSSKFPQFEPFYLNKLQTNLNIRSQNKKDFKELFTILETYYNNPNMTTQATKQMRTLVDKIGKKGFDGEFKFDLDSFGFMGNDFGDIDLNVQLQLPKNEAFSIDAKENNFEDLSKIDAHLTMDSKNLETLHSTGLADKLYEFLDKYKKIQNAKAVYDIQVQNGKTTINGQLVD